MTLYAFGNPCVAFPAFESGVVCLGRVSIRGENLTGGDSITFDRLFV